MGEPVEDVRLLVKTPAPPERSQLVTELAWDVRSKKNLEEAVERISELWKG